MTLERARYEAEVQRRGLGNMVQFLGYRYDKFWYCMDTFKEQQELNDMFERRDAPWEVWKNGKV